MALLRIPFISLKKFGNDSCIGSNGRGVFYFGVSLRKPSNHHAAAEATPETFYLDRKKDWAR